MTNLDEQALYPTPQWVEQGNSELPRRPSWTGLLAVLALIAGGCSADPAPPEPDALPDVDSVTDSSRDTTPSPRVCGHRDPLRSVFFGDLHVHTARSLDANLQGTRLTPADAYRFARGESVGIQPYGVDGKPLRTVALDRPLDFAAVTDHAEFFGATAVCSTPGTTGYDHPDCVTFRDDPDVAFITLNSYTAFAQSGVRLPPMCGDAGEACLEPAAGVWQEIQDAAASAYDLTDACTFTTFVGYEWTGNPQSENLHRNVLFAGTSVPAIPTSYFEAPYVEQLWAALRSDCLEATPGDDAAPCDVLAIPHNANLSNGRMFNTDGAGGKALDAPMAAERALMEPLIEIMQHKGDGECTPNGPAADELCGFEKMPYNSLGSANLDIDNPPPATDFVRAGLGVGLGFLESIGVDPFRYGFVASTDTHIAAPGLVSEGGFPGHGGAGRGNRDALPAGLTDSVAFNPGGLAAIWAEENTRESLFAGLRRRETYGTSGPRLTLRMFGGFDLDDALCTDDAFVARGYAAGVPMGGTLPVAPDAAGTAPTFAIAAGHDAGGEGTPLQRVQIIKGWRDATGFQVKVFEVAGTPDNGADVDLATCRPRGDGATDLCGTWRDPDFDPAEPAFYYARALENPTCRWSTRQCVAAGVDCGSAVEVPEAWAGCCDVRFAKTVQERAWASPIYYVPAGL
ncbi:MAG: hypothetical protein ACI9MR_002591 [Myxococcota bacterium]|jgi:hypothetical protein